jgi:uncharacterized protein
MPSTPKIRLILDTNWYVSAVISLKSRRLFYEQIVCSGRIQVYYSLPLLAEFQTVISRRKFKKYIKPDQIDRFLRFLLPRLLLTDVLPFSGVRDKKDNYLIGMAMACNADFLVTGDDDLLTLGVIEHTTILRMSQFLQVLSFIR